MGEGALPQDGGGDGGVKEAEAAGPAPEQEFQLGRREEPRLSPAPPPHCSMQAVHSRSGLPCVIEDMMYLSARAVSCILEIGFNETEAPVPCPWCESGVYAPGYASPSWPLRLSVLPWD